MTQAKVESQRVRESELVIRSGGSGLPFIWGHNLLGCMDVDDEAGIFDWRALEREANVVRYDARGHGGSQGSDQPEDYAWEILAHDMLAIADKYASKGKYVLGGASMGCATALHAALQAPERIAALVLALPPAAWRTREKQAKRYRLLAQNAALFSRHAYLLFNVLPDHLHARNPRHALAMAVAKRLVNASVRHSKAALRGAAQSDLPNLGELNRLAVPVAILAWQDDDAHPVATADILASVLPDVRLFNVSEADEVAQWTDDLVAFLRKLN